MIIAVTYDNGQIFQHFGHTEQFKLYEVADNQVVTTTVVSNHGSGHGALAAILRGLNADALICGGIGGGAQRALAENNVTLYAGVAGDADAAVEALLAGKLDYHQNATCDHHGENHGADHECGDHGCGSGNCHH